MYGNRLEKKTEIELGRILEEVVTQLKELLHEELYRVVLYGSYARGDFDNESDMDIMVILKGRKEKVAEYRKKVSLLASRIGLEYDIELSVVLRDKETFEQNKGVVPFYKNVQREGIALYG